MDFQEFKKYLIWLVVVVFTSTQLFLYPMIYFYPVQKPTVDFLVAFAPWFCAVIFSLVFLGSWIWERTHKKKRLSGIGKIITPPTGNALAVMTPEEKRILFESLVEMKPKQITAILDSLLKANVEVIYAKTTQETTAAAKNNPKTEEKKESGKA